MLIDTADRRRPEPVPEPVELDWRLWFWVLAGVVFFVAATSVAGGPGVVLAFAGFGASCKALDSFLGRYTGGLMEWRQ